MASGPGLLRSFLGLRPERRANNSKAVLLDGNVEKLLWERAVQAYGDSVVDTLNQDINQISDLNGKNIENAKSSLAACVALDEEAIRLQRLVGGFRI